MKIIQDFFGGPINYSACNEDGRSELSIVKQIDDARDFLVIAGGGERLFNLLVEDRAEARFDVVDGNRSQLFLLELKKLCILTLPPDTLRAFLGLTDMSPKQRRDVYQQQIRPGLSSPAQAYFDAHLRRIARGILYQGEFEQFLKIIATACGLVFGKTLKNFFACQTLDQQQRYFHSHIDGVRWQTLMWVLCRKIWFRLLSRDPAFYVYEGLDSYYKHLRGSIEHALLNIPAKENFLLSLMLTGRYQPEFDVMPPCYRDENIDAVKKNILQCEINLHHALLGDFLGATTTDYDFMSLSDIPSYVSSDELVGLLGSIASHLSPQAYVVIRQLFSRHNVFTRQKLTECRLMPITALEDGLKQTDSSFIYQFQVLQSAA